MSATPAANMRRPMLGRLGRKLETPSQADIEVSLLTGGIDKPYVFGLAMSLASKAVRLDVIGSDAVDHPDFHATPKLNFLNLRGSRLSDTSIAEKVGRLLRYYVRLIRYAAIAKPKIFHILWNNRIQFFDRTLLMLFYRLLGKKIVLTAHNVNAGKRDSNDSVLNRLTLRIQYRLADHIFVHTDKMKTELLDEFGIQGHSVTVIPFGINNSVVNTGLTQAEARLRLGLKQNEKSILFFGSIRPYKGLDHLIRAFELIATQDSSYRLIMAGESLKESGTYLDEIRQLAKREGVRDRVTSKFHFIPDEETELYFTAADVAVLPYTHVYQSGVLFLAYRFGLPVIATDVGSFREDIVEGRTGFLCKACDASDLARAIQTYFASDLYEQLPGRRQEIRDHAGDKNSWNVVAELTFQKYAEILAGGI